MCRQMIIFMTLIWILPALGSPVVDESRLVDWRQAGLEFERSDLTINEKINITHPRFGATPDDDSDDDWEAINNALTEAITEGKNINGLFVIYFPPGAYHIRQPIKLSEADSNIVFIGAGESTVLYFPALDEYSEGASPHSPFQIEGKQVAKTDATADMNKGESYIQVTSISGIKKGDWIYVRETTSDQGPYIGQIFKVFGFYNDAGQDIIIMDTKASLPYRKDYGLKIFKITPVNKVGIENLKIYRENTRIPLFNKLDKASNVFFNNAVNCWMKGVYLRYTFKHHINVRLSSHIEITGCRLDNAYYHGGGGYGYGVCLELSSTECLVENNIVSHCRHQLLAQYGANTNVFGYNYSRDQVWTNYPNNTGADICLHGSYAYANLFEGNRCVNIYADDTHNQNGPFNTFLRNYTDDPEGWLPYVQAATFKNINYYNFIANQHVEEVEYGGSVNNGLNIYVYSYPDGYPWSTKITVPHANTLIGENPEFINELSYYYCDHNHVAQTNIPDFLAAYGCSWPPIGPGINLDMDASIESVSPHENAARIRWNNGGIMTYNPDPIITGCPVMDLPSTINSDASIRGIFNVPQTMTINNNAMLTIGHPATLRLYPTVSIITENGGKISAYGTTTQTDGMIKFERFNANQPWGAIELRSGDNEFHACLFHEGINNIYIRSTDNYFETCFSYGATSAGIRAGTVYGTSQYSNFRLNECEITENYYGINAYKSYGDIHGCKIGHNTLDGIYLYYSSLGDYAHLANAFFVENIIWENQRYGLYIGPGSKAFFGYWLEQNIPGHNKIVNNKYHEVYLNGNSAYLYGQAPIADRKLFSTIYDEVYPSPASSNKYIRNYAKTSDGESGVTIYAWKTYWGSAPHPTADDFSGFTVNRDYPLGSDVTGISIPSDVNPDMNEPDIQIQPVLSQAVARSVSTKNRNVESVDTKSQLMTMRNEISDQKDPEMISHQLSEYFRLYDARSEPEITEKREISKVLADYTANLKELSNSDYGDINAPFTPPTAKGREKLLAERAAMHEIFMLHGESNYTETLERINKYEQYIQNYDNRRELLSYKMDTYYSLGRYKESYATLKELKKFIRPDKSWTDIPTYEMFERDLCEELGIEYGLLDEQVEKEYQEELANPIPTEFVLRNNYPNPFNPETTIPFDLPEDSYVSIRVYNVLGQLVSKLTDRQFNAGSHTVKFHGQNLASGMYIIKAHIKTQTDKAKNYAFTHKMLLMK